MNSLPPDDAPDHCWCGLELTLDGLCPEHNDPTTSALEQRADYKLEELLENPND